MLVCSAGCYGSICCAGVPQSSLCLFQQRSQMPGLIRRPAPDAARLFMYSKARQSGCAATCPSADSVTRATLWRVVPLKRSTRHSSGHADASATVLVALSRLRVAAGCAVTETTPLPCCDMSSKMVTPSLWPQPPPCVPIHSCVMPVPELVGPLRFPSPEDPNVTGTAPYRGQIPMAWVSTGPAQRALDAIPSVRCRIQALLHQVRPDDVLPAALQCWVPGSASPSIVISSPSDGLRHRAFPTRLANSTWSAA